MSAITERQYFATRADTARRMEARAADPTIAAIHRAMAERYEALASDAADPRRIETIEPQILI